MQDSDPAWQQLRSAAKPGQSGITEAFIRQEQPQQESVAEAHGNMAMMQQQMTSAMQEAEQQLGALMGQLSQAEAALQAASARIACLQAGLRSTFEPLTSIISRGPSRKNQAESQFTSTCPSSMQWCQTSHAIMSGQ